jgi:hypothetical protein
MLKSIFAAAAVASLVSLAACNDPNSAEEQGEAADTAMEQATTGETDMGDGPMENAGEVADEAADDAADAMPPADPATPPATNP